MRHIEKQTVFGVYVLENYYYEKVLNGTFKSCAKKKKKRKKKSNINTK
jgi:hypothetical protein